MGSSPNVKRRYKKPVTGCPRPVGSWSQGAPNRKRITQLPRLEPCGKTRELMPLKQQESSQCKRILEKSGCCTAKTEDGIVFGKTQPLFRSRFGLKRNLAIQIGESTANWLRSPHA
jgi:hypothetical protein